MQTRILGTTMPVLEVELDPNESVFSESGELSWMTASIQMTTHTQMGGGGGLFGVLKRVAAGGSIFMTEYRAFQYPGAVSFATKVPGHIVPVELGQGPEYLVHRHGFLCATPQVTITRGLSAVAGRGHLWRRRIPAAARGRRGHGVAGALRRADPEEPCARRGAARASRPRGRVPGVGRLPDHHGSGHQEHDLRRRRAFPGGAGRARARCGCRRCPSRGWRTRSASICRTAKRAQTPAAVGGGCWAASSARFWAGVNN